MFFSTLSQYFDKLENTTSRLAMTEILADLFSQSHNDEIGKICYLLQGRVLPLYEAVEFGMADKMMIKALASAYNISVAEITELFKKKGDLGITGQILSEKLKVSAFAKASADKKREKLGVTRAKTLIMSNFWLRISSL